jgi:ADP-ribosyl-[dinitrogen reductase] hydrolase
MTANKSDGCGVLLGLACGDALGRPVEFKSNEWINQEYGTVTEMLSNGTYGKPAGTVTDDTEMALCIARSLVENDAFQPRDIANRFVEWYKNGPFDIGNLTRDVLQQLSQGRPWDEAGYEIWKTLSEGRNAGNGSVMRCAPYAVAFADKPKILKKVSQQSSSITHADPRCTYGCAVLNLTLSGLLHDEKKPLTSALDSVRENAPAELLDALDPIAVGRKPDSLQSTGFVIHSLQTALYYGLSAETPEDGIVSVVNMGGDTDTIGAITGAVVGARFGKDEIPNRWLTELESYSELNSLGSTLAKNRFEAPEIN